MDDRWYTPDLGIQTEAGVTLTAETVLRCAAVLAAVRFKAEAVAVCKPRVIEYLPDGSRRPAPTHYAQLVLRDPNAWQTGYEWTHFNVVSLCLWGNAYNRIVPGPSSFAERLEPLHPGCVSIVGVDSEGGNVYQYRNANGQTETLMQNQVLHYSGLSVDGRSGAAMYRLIRNVVGISLAVEKHAGVFLKKGTRVSGILSTDQKLTQDVKQAVRESWNATFSLTSEQAGGVAVLGDNMKFTPMAGNNREAQLIELDADMTSKLLMAIGVPGVVVGYQGDKANTYASADAFFEKGGIKHCVLPTAMNMEERDRKSLLLRSDNYVVRRDLDILMRSNTKDRYDALVKACGGPFMTRNEVRAIEDMNRDPAPEMDRVLMPVNLAPTGEDVTADPGAQPPEPAPRFPTPDDPTTPPEDAAAQGRRPPVKPTPADRYESRAWQFVSDAAARVVRREIATLTGRNGRGLAVRYAGSPDKWRAEVAAYYQTHAAYVAETMRIPAELAAAYCERQAEALIAGGVAVAATWEADVVPDLAALAMSGTWQAEESNV